MHERPLTDARAAGSPDPFTVLFGGRRGRSRSTTAAPYDGLAQQPAMLGPGQLICERVPSGELINAGFDATGFDELGHLGVWGAGAETALVEFALRSALAEVPVIVLDPQRRDGGGLFAPMLADAWRRAAPATTRTPVVQASATVASAERGGLLSMGHSIVIGPLDYGEMADELTALHAALARLAAGSIVVGPRLKYRRLIVPGVDQMLFSHADPGRARDVLDSLVSESRKLGLSLVLHTTEQMPKPALANLSSGLVFECPPSEADRLAAGGYLPGDGALALTELRDGEAYLTRTTRAADGSRRRQPPVRVRLVPVTAPADA